MFRLDVFYIHGGEGGNTCYSFVFFPAFLLVQVWGDAEMYPSRNGVGQMVDGAK